MQNVDTTDNNDAPKEIKTVEIDQTTQTSAMTGPTLIENPQVPTSQSTFGLDVSCSDDDEVSEVDSFILDTEDADPALEPSFLLPQSMEGANLQTVTVDPETHARLEALLEAAGIGKLSTADGKALTDPEVLRKLTSSVSCALDEAAQALHRMRAEQQLGAIDTSRSLAEACSDGDVPTVRKLLREGGSVHETTEEGDSLLSLACSAGYYELAQVLLAMKANVEDRGIKGDCTPLMEAASGGYVDIVKLLISHGADVNAQSSAGNTPLHYGACGGYMDVVQVLIEAGANVEQHNENGHTPLMEAASAGHVTVASILLQAGAGINTHSNEFKESALTLACYKGHLDMVKFLLEAGADQEHKTDEMHTALMEASMDGHVEVAKLLLDSGAQVNMPADSFESPLTLAACGGHVELALLLIERGANLEEVNDEGYTPLMEAAREGHEEMVALLLAHGNADINAQTEETQETALTLACCGGFLDVADFLITAGADIELGCSTPLMEAAQEGHLELVKYLLKAKANVQAQTGTGDTALTYACENGHTDVAEVLLQHGAVLEHESEGGRTPLMKAARAGHLCTVQFLISKGADVNRQTSTNDHTVLSLACAGGHLAVVELLLAQGADPAHKLKDGSTMVIEAAKGGHTQVVKLLLEYPNRMLMNNTQQDLPQLPANDSHLVESRVPIHGLANIVPPSEPDSHPAKPNNLTTCEHTETQGVKRKASVAEMNIPIKPTDQILQNMQKSLAKKSPGTGNSQQPDSKSNKNINLPSPSDVTPQVTENGELPEIMSDETIDLKATERLEAIISNVMAKELINTTSTREEQILRKQQILEELQKVERELQEKAQQQLLITAQHQLEQQQQQQQLQQALQASVGNKPLHKVLQKQLEEQGKKKLPLSSPTITPSSPVVTPSSPVVTPSISNENNQVPFSKETSLENQISNNLDKQAPIKGEVTTASPTVKPNIPENVPAVSQTAEVGVADNQQSRQNNELNNNKNVKSNGGLLSTNGGSQSTEHNGGSQSSEPPKSPAIQPPTSQPKPQPQTPSLPTPPQSASPMIKPQLPASQALTGQPLMFNPPSLPTTMTTMTQPSMIPPPKPSALLPQVTQQLEQQQQQMLLQQQQTGVMPQFVLNETQRQTLQNLILRQQQEAQQLAQQASSLPFHQLQLTPQQQDQLFQVLSNQQISQQMLQQQQPQNLQQQQQQQQLQSLLQQQTTMTQQILNQQQQAQFLQQQQQAQLLQQQLQQIKPPVNPQKPAVQRKTKNLLNMQQQMNNQEQGVPGVLGIDTATPRSPPSTPLTPNPSPASPDSISPLYAPIDLDAQTESNHDTALTLACAGGHSELVTLLLSKGADIEHRDKKGFTPLILAATAGHVDVVEILLEHGADIEAQSERTKDTPLSLACSGGRYEVVELLLSRGANKEHRNVSDYTPLSLAASGGFVNIIKLLLSHGAEINSRTGSKLGISPLMLAAMNGHTAAVKLLLDMGSDINAQIETNKNTALTLACFQGRHEVVSLLVDRKAIIEHRAKTGLTPLMEAASGGYVEVGRVLLDKGADVNAPPVPSSRDTALTIAADKGHYRFVELLLSRHAAVDVKNKKGNSPLWLACHGGHLDVVQLIVTAGADIDSQDNRKVSCLMAAFRKGHIKVVKWMVKHVNQFPSDGDLSRYIATITDKELQKKCQQCMEIIVTAKDRQAAEAYKNATNLLELLDKERQHEENKKAAAAKKREKKKKKKKEKQVKDKEEPSDSKNSTPEPESEDSQPKELDEEKEQPLVLEPPSATTTSTLGLTLPTSEPIYSKAKGRSNKPEKRNSKSDTQMMVVKPIDNKRNSKTDTQMTIVENRLPSSQDENKEPKNNKGDGNNKTNAKTTESRKNKKNRRDKENDRVPDIDMSGDSRVNAGIEITTTGSVMSTGVEERKGKNMKSKKKKGERFGKDLPVVGSSTTPIGDLDDFGNLPSISERDIERYRKSVDKNKTGHGDKGGSHYIDKSHPEVNPNTLSVKTSPNLVNSPKRGQKKEDGWKEVIRKSKKVPVPASAISRVIGRGGCNINAIREVSGANIDVEKNKGSSGERIITIKGSAEATRQAHALISALVSDPDKELQEILPKSKAKQQLENKSLYFIPPNDTNSSPASSQSSGSQQSKSGNKLAPRLQAAQANAGGSRSTMGGGGVMNSPITVWGGPPTTTSASPQRTKQKHGSAPAPFSSPVPGLNGSMLDKSVTRQLFSAEQKRKGGFGSPTMITTQSNIMSGSANTKTTPSSPPSFGMRPDMRLSPGTRNQTKPLIPGNVKVLQRPNAGAGLQPQPLPIIANQTTTTATTQTITSASGFNISSSSGEYSPFDNLFSNAAQQLLGKKDDSMNERMNFASVAAAGVIPTFTGSPGNLGTPSSPGGPVDPGLLAKAPGFKLPGPRMMNPLEMAPGFKGGGFPMSQQMMDMNMFGMNGPGPQGFQNFPQPIQSQSPNSSPRSSQSASSGMSPHSSSGFDSSQSLQREEYTTPSQPMTLPKISSSLNPNAPDFMSRTAPPGSNSGPGGPGMGMIPQAMYQQALAQQLLSAFNTMGPAPNPPPGAPSPGPQNQDPLLGMGGQFNKQEFYQNMANLMHQWAIQNQPPGSPGPGMGPSQGPGFPSAPPRAFSPLPAQGRPNSAPSIGGMPKDGPSGPSPTPIGPPRTNSPLPPSTPPMPDIMRLNEDRRQPRPIGGERSIRKAPGPGPIGVPPGNLEFNDPLWNPSPQLGMDWNLKGTTPGLTSNMSSVMTTSVLSGAHMTSSLSANGEERVVDLENHDPSRGLDDLSEHNFSPGLQGQGLGQMPLFNGVGPYQLQEGTGFGGSGDGLPSMWNTLDTPDSEDITEKGLWNSWNK